MMFRTSEKKTDEELGSWLNAIPNAPCLNLHHDLPEHVTIGSPVSRVSPASDSSASSYFSDGFHFPGCESSYSAPSLDMKHQVPENYYSTRLKLNSDSCAYQSPFSAPFHENWVHDLSLSEGLYRMNITDGGGNCAKTKNYEMDSYRFGFDSCSVRANIPCYTEACTLYKGNLNEVPTYEGTCGVSPSSIDDMKRALPALGKGCTFGTSVGSFLANGESCASSLGSSLNGSQIYHLMEQRKKQESTSYDEVQLQKPYITTPYGFIMGSQISVMDYEVGRCVKNPFNSSQSMQPNLAVNVNHPSHSCPPRERTRASANSRQFLSPNRAGGDSVAFQCDNSFILPGKDIKYHIGDGCDSLKGCKKNFHNEIAIRIEGENVSAHNYPTPGSQENNGNIVRDFSLQLLLSFYSVAQVKGYIYNLAKDQNSCRFLQRMVDKGTGEDLKIVFEGIIDNVVELMMDPSGNYLVQKLLDACREEQKLQIVFMVTKEPGQLVRISLNAHGTRVVQKLIETLNTGKQISLVKSALEPGILNLVKDLNGNHVIQRCLQCFSCQDNEFIFNAAAKFCVDIATHQHGCCVLQRCIDHAMGKYRDKLVTEICRHGILLSQDPFGNYVVQYIIEMKIPTASAKLRSQFKGNYVNLSTQKFSSHVVEKCLKHVGESRQRIVQELLSVSNFEQLLQDPFANYVIQSALAVTKGPLHASLVEAVRPYKILRTSPYCKRIFSGSLLKK